MYSSSSPIATPLPQDFLAFLPEEIPALESRYRRQLKLVDGQSAARSALAASLEILLKEDAKQVPWIPILISRLREARVPASSDPLASWSHLRLKTFFLHLFRESWNRETCAEIHRAQWSERTPECGQTCLSALIIQKHISGKIRQATLIGPSYGLYYLNELADGDLFEIGRDQFNQLTQVLPGREVTRDELLDPEHPRGQLARAAKVPERYALLEQRFLVAAGAMALAASRVLKNVGPD